MPFEVQLTRDAVGDLEEIDDYIRRHDGPGNAKHFLDRIDRAFASLADRPHRGRHPKELLEVGVREYREIFFKPYRIVYRVLEDNGYVLLIADGERDMQTLLQRRLLQP